MPRNESLFIIYVVIVMSRAVLIDESIFDLAVVFIRLSLMAIAKELTINLLTRSLSAISTLEPDSSITFGIIIFSITTIADR